MNQSDNNLLVGILIFTIGFLSAATGQFYPEFKILIRLAFIFSLIYLFLGWYIFRSYFPGGNPLLLFVMGFFYSGIFLASVFHASGWPLASTFVCFTPVWIIAQISLVLSQRKKLSRESVIQFMIESGLLMGLAIYMII